jgi:hypothetical protein
VRVTGQDRVTRLTWRALAVEGQEVRLAVESLTTDPKSKAVTSTSSEERRPVRDAAPGGEPEMVNVGGRALRTRRATVGETTVWRSAEVPLGGVVRSEGPGGAVQTLVEFGRGR